MSTGREANTLVEALLRDINQPLGFSADGKLSAHYENTVLITDGEPEILTVAEGL